MTDKFSHKSWMDVVYQHSPWILTTDSNNIPGIHIEENARLPLLCSFSFLSCETENLL